MMSEEDGLPLYGLQTYTTDGYTNFSTENNISNVVLIGYLDITEAEGLFVMPDGKIPPGRSFFHFPVLNLHKLAKSGVTPLIAYQSIYTEDGRLRGFSWYRWTLYSGDTYTSHLAPNPEFPQVRVYYGYY